MIYEWNAINSRPLKHPVLYVFGYVYIAIPLLFWIIFLYHNPMCKNHLLLIFIVVWAVDVFAFFGGSLFKGPKLAPSISPKKTWSGAIVGCLMSVIIVTIACIYLSQLTISLSNVLLALLLAISAVVGDLIESKAKRMINVKDSGNIIPGHGGMCDRLDSFLMATYVYAIIILTS
jgi:phosphatidate cytidylyltransferase